MFILLSWQNSMLVNYALQAWIVSSVSLELCLSAPFWEEGSEGGGGEVFLLWPKWHLCPGTFQISLWIGWRATECPAGGTSLEGALRGAVLALAVSPTERGPLVSPTHQVSMDPWLFQGQHPKHSLAQQQPGPWKSFQLLQELWTRFIAGDHTAEDQWLMNIHGESSLVGSACLQGWNPGCSCRGAPWIPGFGESSEQWVCVKPVHTELYLF